jgi:penicillin-binding protein 1C
VYDEWLAKQPTSNFVSDQLRILSPSNGNLFLIYPGAETQKKISI